MITGIQKTVMQDNNTITGCFFCTHCNDTGHSYICNKTGEKLEGFTTLEDKINNNLNELLKRNISIGVGNKCPLPTLKKDKMTEIKLNVSSLSEIETFINDNEREVNTCIENDELIVTVFFFDDGYESNEDFMAEVLSDVINKVEDQFECSIKDGDCGEGFESVIITI